MEDIKVKSHTQYSELANKFEHIESQKSKEITATAFEYEEKLHRMEERLKTTQAEIQKIRDRAAADVVMYQKVNHYTFTNLDLINFSGNYS